MIITQEMIDRFADVTMDHQWIHNDVERAKRESPFGGPIAHGFLILSLVNVLPDGSDRQVVGFGSAINYGADKLRFVSPVPAGASIARRSRIVHVRKKGPGGTQLTVDNEVAVVGAEKPAMLYRAIALFLP